MNDKELAELHTRMGGTPTRPTYNESKVTPVIEQPRGWVGLTDDEIESIWYTVHAAGKHGFARAVENKLKELNT